MSKLRILAGLALATVWLYSTVDMDAQAQGQRVPPFKRLTEMRVKPPAGMRPLTTSACPRTQDPMCKEFWEFGSWFVNNNKIPARDREILIFRIAWLNRAQFMWASHVQDWAPKAGLTPEEIARVPQGASAKGWSEFDTVLLQAADELHANRFVSDATWKALGEKYTERQQLEVVLTVGNYNTLSMFFNSTGGVLEPGMPKMPGE